MKILGWLNEKPSEAELRRLQDAYEPNFESKLFALVCPTVDGSIDRRMAWMAGSTTSKPSQDPKEKNLMMSQRRLLDVARPIISVWSQMDQGVEVREALEAALRIWANAFRSITEQRRLNIFKQTDLADYVRLLEDPTTFINKEFNFLFGSKFLERLVKERSDRTLGSMPSKKQKTGPNNKSNGKSRGKGDHRKGSFRGRKWGPFGN